ncbi:flippase-like domain-containing protein [Geoglobus acetivorans]|uniref:Flippase-like domain-containing protein n=1 Tax=Geoglobus acetivorans TaxID=565033 RepID=A0ABZ3H1Y2_GEOAI
MFTIIVPAHNEAERLEESIESLVNFLRKEYDEFEIIIAEDGSTDGTDRIARSLEEKYSFVRHLHSEERLGKGRAVFEAAKISKFPVVVYMDADLSTDLKHIRDLLSAIDEGYDIAVGSRLVRGSEIKRPLKRELPSRLYNLLARKMLGSNIRDHQCGFKAFRKDVLLKLGELARDNHWFWDTEILVLAQKKGYRIKEIPVRWEHYEGSSVSVIKTSLYLFSSLLRHSERAFLYFSIGVTLLIFATLVYFANPEKLVQSFRALNYVNILIAFIMYLASFLLRGVRYEHLMKNIGGSAGVGYAVMATAISQTLNILTPVRIGDLGRAYVYSRKGVSYQTSFSGLAAERIYDVIAILIIAFFSIAFVGMAYFRMLFYAVIFLGIIIAGVIFLSKTRGYVAKVMGDAKGLIFSRMALFFIPLSLSIWMVDVLVCYIVLRSFSDAPLYLPAFAVAMGNVVKILPLTPGGIGTYEATLTLILSSWITRDEALVVAIADHAIKNIGTLVLGLLSSIKLGLSLREMRK